MLHPNCKKCLFIFCFLIFNNDDLQCWYNSHFYTWLKVQFSSFNIEIGKQSLFANTHFFYF